MGRRDASKWEMAHLETGRKKRNGRRKKWRERREDREWSGVRVVWEERDREPWLLP